MPSEPSNASSVAWSAKLDRLMQTPPPRRLAGPTLPQPATPRISRPVDSPPAPSLDRPQPLRWIERPTTPASLPRQPLPDQTAVTRRQPLEFVTRPSVTPGPQPASASPSPTPTTSRELMPFPGPTRPVQRSATPQAASGPTASPASQRGPLVVTTLPRPSRPLVSLEGPAATVRRELPPLSGPNPLDPLNSRELLTALAGMRPRDTTSPSSPSASIGPDTGVSYAKQDATWSWNAADAIRHETDASNPSVRLRVQQLPSSKK